MSTMRRIWRICWAMGRLPEAWIAPPATRELRELVRVRGEPVSCAPLPPHAGLEDRDQRGFHRVSSRATVSRAGPPGARERERQLVPSYVATFSIESSLGVMSTCVEAIMWVLDRAGQALAF